MATVAYELAIVGGRLSTESNAAFCQCEELDRLAKFNRGSSVGIWEYHFPSFDEAKAFEMVLRLSNVKFEDIRIRTVDADTGEELRQ